MELVLCTDNADCFLWIGWLDVPTDLVKIIDKKIDGLVDGSEGEVRYLGWKTNTSSMYIKTLIKYPFL